MTMTQKQFDLDPSLVPMALAMITPAANDDFNWEAELAADPAYDAWVNEQAMAWNFSHARMPGE